MNIQIKTYNEEIGFHYWKNAPEEVSFLKNRHRHRFEIRCYFSVEGSDREIEIFMKEREIHKYLKEKYGEELELGGKSCEMLAIELIQKFNADSCEVLEDGKGGAYVRK